MVQTTTDKKVLYKAQSGAGVMQMKESVGAVIKIKNIIQFETTNQEGEPATATTLEGEDGKMYQTLSPYVAENCQTLYNIFKDEIEAGDGPSVEIQKRQSNGGNTYFYLNLL